MTNEERKIILEAHVVNLRAANTFEEYKAAHIAYVEYLIEVFDLQDQQEALMLKFAENANAK